MKIMKTNEPIKLYQNLYYYKRKDTKQKLPYKYASNCVYTNEALAKANSLKDWEEQKIDNNYVLYTTILRLIIWKE